MKNYLVWLILIFIAVFILGCFALFSDIDTNTEDDGGSKVSKQILANKYAISRPTLKKWIEYFQNKWKIEDWNKKRFLTQSDVSELDIAFGNEYDLVLSKGQIAIRAYSDYKTVSENVIRNLDKIGITKEAWHSCNCFPPEITKRILEVLG